MLISELARRAKLHPATLRRLERKGLLLPDRDANGWRVYGPEAVKVLQDYYKRELVQQEESLSPRDERGRP